MPVRQGPAPAARAALSHGLGKVGLLETWCRSQKARLRDVALVRGAIEGGKLQREQGRLQLRGPTAPARSRPVPGLDCIRAEHPRVTYLSRAHSFSR